MTLNIQGWGDPCGERAGQAEQPGHGPLLPPATHRHAQEGQHLTHTQMKSIIILTYS